MTSLHTNTRYHMSYPLHIPRGQYAVVFEYYFTSSSLPWRSIQ